MPELSDAELLQEVLLSEELTDYEHRAFEDMQDAILKGKRSFLTSKQRAWAQGIASRSDDYVEEPKNLFSGMTPERQEREKERAAAVVLPWEREGYTPPKPMRR